MSEQPADPSAPAPDLRLPAGRILLHIGPYKTGSTALQSALVARRDELAPYGVAYPGNWRRLFAQGHALMQWSPRGRKLPPVKVWDDFAASVRAMDDVTVCLSTEDFGRIRDPQKTRKIVEDLGADRLHVVAVARAYHRLMPSHWQERMKSFVRYDYTEFLRRMLEGDADDPAVSSFWASHDFEEMWSRWRDLLPPERFTVIATDDSDRSLLTHTFEQMLGLPPDFLRLDDNANSSLTYNAIEVLRGLNAEWHDRRWPDRLYVDLVQQGMVPELGGVGRDSGDRPIPALPAWALPLVEERTRRRVAAIEEAGVRVVGDLRCLSVPDGYEPSPEGALDPPDTVSTRAATAALAGVVDAVRREQATQRRPPGSKRRKKKQAPPPTPRLDEVSSRDLLREVARRQARRVRRSARD